MQGNPTLTTLHSTPPRSRTPLQNLPAELLLEIATFLPRVYLMSLSYTYTNRYRWTALSRTF